MKLRDTYVESVRPDLYNPTRLGDYQDIELGGRTLMRTIDGAEPFYAARMYAEFSDNQQTYERLLVATGKSVEDAKLEASERLEESKQTCLELAARSLGVDLTTLEETQVLEFGQALIEHDSWFSETVEARKGELGQLKSEFVDAMQVAIVEQGLPLTTEQLNDRLEDVELVFTDPLNRPTAHGVSSPLTNQAWVRVDLSPEMLKRTVFHELLHTLSGSAVVGEGPEARIRRSGLAHKHNRTWINEAVTELLTNLLIDPDLAERVNFGATKMQKFKGWRALSHSVYENHWDSYYDERQTLLPLLRTLPMNTLLRAYFAEDNDPLEEDQRAGAHAERDLERAFKVQGGAKKLQKLRVVETMLDSDDKKTRKNAVKKAHKMVGREFGMVAPVKRVVRKHQMHRSQIKRQNGINRAKQAESSSR